MAEELADPVFREIVSIPFVRIQLQPMLTKKRKHRLPQSVICKATPELQKQESYGKRQQEYISDIHTVNPQEDMTHLSHHLLFV